MRTSLICLFPILVKYQLTKRFCIVIYALNSIIHNVLILCLVFPINFLSKHVFPNCIRNNNSSFHHFVSRAVYCMFDGSQDFTKDQYIKWSAFSSNKKIDITYLTFPHRSTYCILPTLEQLLVKLQNGIANYFNS